MNKPKRGGPRVGAGRKARDAQPRNIPRSIKVSEDVDLYLDHTGTGIVEEMLRRSASFKEWRKLRGQPGGEN